MTFDPKIVTCYNYMIAMLAGGLMDNRLGSQSVGVEFESCQWQEFFPKSLLASNFHDGTPVE